MEASDSLSSQPNNRANHNTKEVATYKQLSPENSISKQNIEHTVIKKKYYSSSRYYLHSVIEGRALELRILLRSHGVRIPRGYEKDAINNALTHCYESMARAHKLI